MYCVLLFIMFFYKNRFNTRVEKIIKMLILPI